MYDLRKTIKPSWDYEFLSWPLWHDNIQIPKIRVLANRNVVMVADVLDQEWNVLQKQALKEKTHTRLNFLKYMAINRGTTKFIKNAVKETVNVGPHRPAMLNLVFTQQKECRDRIL